MQVEGASLLIQAKLESNQQSSVGLGLMGGAQVQILCTMTSDSVKANSFLFGVKCTGQLHFTQVLSIILRQYKLEHLLSSIDQMILKSKELFALLDPLLLRMLRL